MEAAMMNDVVLEGIVVRTRKYADDLLFLLACFRDPYLLQKPLNDVQDAADFITIRVPKANLGAPVVETSLHVRLFGFLQSRDYGPLFSFMDGLRRESERRYCIERKGMERSISDTQVDSGQISTGVEIVLQMSHKTLTGAEEDIQ
jgi:hypothetical protein